MNAKQTLSLSKRFVWGVLGLAFGLVVAASLLTFTASRKLASTLDELENNQKFATEIGRLPVLLDALLMQTRAWVRDPGQDSGPVRDALDKIHDLMPGSAPLAEDIVDFRKLEQLDALAHQITRRVDSMLALRPADEADRIQSLWREIEDSGAEPRLHALTGTLREIAHRQFIDHATAGERTAEVYQSVGLGLIALAAALGVLGAVLLSRRIHELESFITVCAWTKRVRYQDRWVPFEEFLEKRFRLKLSHGISEEAVQMELDRARPEAAPD